MDPRSKFNQKRVDIIIERGSITKISKQLRPKGKIVDPKNLCVSPGWIDLGTVVSDPGFEFKEVLSQTLDSASRGGFTGLVPLPKTNPVHQNKEQVENLINKGSAKGIDLYPIASLSKDNKGEQLNDLKDLISGGAIGFSDESFSDNPEILSHALRYLGDGNGLVVSLARDLDLSDQAQLNEGKMSTQLGLKGFPPEAEVIRVSRDLELLRLNGGRIHFHKVSSTEALKLIKKAKTEGLNVSCDVPSYIFSLDEEILVDYNARFKLDPPLKSKKEITGLIRFLENGTIDAISSGHSPQDIESKDLEFDLADFGGNTLESSFASFWSSLSEDLKKPMIAELFSLGPARILGLAKPKIEEGSDLDISLFQLNTNWDYDADRESRHSDPFDKTRFSARVIGTLKGSNQKIFQFK